MCCKNICEICIQEYLRDAFTFEEIGFDAGVGIREAGRSEVDGVDAGSEVLPEAAHGTRAGHRGHVHPELGAWRKAEMHRSGLPLLRIVSQGYILWPTRGYSQNLAILGFVI